jgi:hypothetical protein
MVPLTLTRFTRFASNQVTSAPESASTAMQRADDGAHTTPVHETVTRPIEVAEVAVLLVM